MTSSSLIPTIAKPSPQKPNSQVWYRPTLSPEHGVYIMLLVSFLSGAALACDWTGATTLALICAFCGFQAEHPLVVQIKQRSSLKPRLLIWGGVYSGMATAIALYLYWQQKTWLSPLLSIYLGAIAAFLIDAISVFHREQKSVLNELITFFAVCLSAPLAHVVTTGTLTTSAIGLWLLNGLFFSSAIFTVKLRKNKQHPITPSLVYHAIAALLVIGLWAIGWLLPVTALAFSLALLKLGIILWQKTWYCTTRIQFVAMLETGIALLFLVIVTLSVLPAHITNDLLL
ncbi:MAG: YwiC-like family protein [Leptolyngbyaceae cyanobacterium bins.349]|nr:YwiC-like family protein [Leptolyngbyaceae cyanobacterium bins.349]